MLNKNLWSLIPSRKWCAFIQLLVWSKWTFASSGFPENSGLKCDQFKCTTFVLVVQAVVLVVWVRLGWRGWSCWNIWCLWSCFFHTLLMSACFAALCCILFYLTCVSMIFFFYILALLLHPLLLYLLASLYNYHFCFICYLYTLCLILFINPQIIYL